MSEGQIVVSGLAKHYKNVKAVNDLSFTVEPGRVTGFLGPNGAGKTTTLRMVLNLVTPTAGTATIGGKRYADLPDPIRHVGGILEGADALSEAGARRPQDLRDVRIQGPPATVPRFRFVHCGCESVSGYHSSFGGYGKIYCLPSWRSLHAKPWWSPVRWMGCGRRRVMLLR
jgi:energy-coupling factor transporter ATP-binding protein EcfA2